MKLANTTVFVTGANRGIGHALIAELRERGVRRIYAATRQPAVFEAVASDVLVPVKLDITNRRQVQQAVQQAQDTTLLINNAGALAFTNLLNGPLEMIMRDMDTNYYGTLNMVRAFAPVIAQHRGGIANVLTLAALASVPALGGYSASKAAAFSLTQALRAELSKQGVSVYGIYPGAVDTEMIDAMTMPKARPVDVASAILDGIEQDVMDIYPDAMAQQLGQLWEHNPKQLAMQLGAL